MKVLCLVLALGFCLAGCEQKKTDPTAEASTGSADKKRGDWMWDKNRGNPLERPAK